MKKAHVWPGPNVFIASYWPSNVRKKRLFGICFLNCKVNISKLFFSLDGGGTCRTNRLMARIERYILILHRN